MNKTQQEYLSREQQEQLSQDLLHYGYIKADVTTDSNDGCRRIRVFEYEGKKYFHWMFNGELVECYEV